jgi:hypothetical protein
LLPGLAQHFVFRLLFVPDGSATSADLLAWSASPQAHYAARDALAGFRIMALPLQDSAPTLHPRFRASLRSAIAPADNASSPPVVISAVPAASDTPWEVKRLKINII